jgi:hypothetical protein
MSNAGKVQELIGNEKLNNLEKLSLVKTHADRIEQNALSREANRQAS